MLIKMRTLRHGRRRRFFYFAFLINLEPIVLIYTNIMLKIVCARIAAIFIVILRADDHCVFLFLLDYVLFIYLLYVYAAITS